MRLNRSRLWYYIAAATVALLGLTQLDIPIARLAYNNPPPRLVVSILESIAAVAAGGYGVLAVLVTSLLIFQVKVIRLPRMISASLGAGLLADIAKMCVFRARPRAVDLSTATFCSTFHGWFPLLSAGSAGQSFPSGHATTAAGLAFTLGMVCPRGRWGFAALALTASIARVVVHAHFPTDVTAGLVLGTGWAYACHIGFAAPAFTWCERKIQSMTKVRDHAPQADKSERHESTEDLLAPRIPMDNEVDIHQSA